VCVVSRRTSPTERLGALAIASDNVTRAAAAALT
jgi:hypothetical protein